MIQKKYLDLEGLSSYTTKIKNYVASLLTKYAPMDNSAGAWNGIYHRKNLLDEFTLDELSSKIALGDFSGIPIGSYIETDIKPSVDGAVLALSGNSTSGTTAYDISGNANNGTMTNITLSSDTDKAFVNNASAKIDLPSAISAFTNVNAITLVGKIKTTSTGGSYVILLLRGSYTACQLTVENGMASAGGRTHSGDEYRYCLPQRAINDGNWHTLSGVFNFSEGKIYLYIDGSLIATNTLASTGTFDSVTNCISVQPMQSSYTGFMKGIKIYPRALSADEILQLHNATQDEGLTERVRPLVAGLDHYLHCGNTPIEDHHLVMVFEDCLKNTAKMNATNTATGGFNGAYLRLAVLPSLLKTLQINLDTSHILTYNALFSTSVSDTSPSMAGAGYTGASNGWGWSPIGVGLMNEIELYGTTVLSSSFYDVGNGKSQFPLFRLRPDLIQCGRGINGSTVPRFEIWLRSVASSANFCCNNGGGVAHSYGASYSFGIRPFFLFK